MARPVHPALRRARWMGALVGVALQTAALTALVHGAAALLDLSWPAIYTAAAALAVFGLGEFGLQRRAAAQRAPAMALAGAVFDRWPEAKVAWMRGLPVIKARLDGRWVALHFETAGLAPFRVGVTVGAWAPVPVWLAARLPEDYAQRAEDRLRIKRRFYEVPLPAGADARLLALSPEPDRTEAWLTEGDETMATISALLLDNPPCAATLEVFGDAVRWDTRLTDRHSADYIVGVVERLVAWLPPLEVAFDDARAVDDVLEAQPAD